jgi:SAM-dependent methyltransferase
MFRKYKIPYHLDDPRATIAHKEIILAKPYLKELYSRWYKVFINKSRENGRGKYLEIGSGGGFLKEMFPEVITSDILPLPGVDRVVNAEELPFADGELGSILMLNVFHHIPRPHLFLKEAQRCLNKGGKIVMIEPANSLLGRIIYKNFHHEPFDEKGGREIQAGNPLSNSNQALPYIYFERDLGIFEKEYPLLKIVSIKYHTPFSYIVSGGVSRSSMIPAFLSPVVYAAEWLLGPLSKQLGLFCTIEIEKK